MADDFNSDAADTAAASPDELNLRYTQGIWGYTIHPPGFGDATAFGDSGHRRVGQRGLQAAPLPADDVFRPMGDDYSRPPVYGNHQPLAAGNLWHLSTSTTPSQNAPIYPLHPQPPSWQPHPAQRPRPQTPSWRKPTQAGSSVAPEPQPTNANAAYPPRPIGYPFNRRQGFLDDNPPVDPNFKFADAYAGNRAAYANYSAAIPDNMNCSVFLRGLPPKVKHHHILSLIRGCGSRIWALHINKPDTKNPHHSAAKLVFYKRCGVDWLFAKIRSGQFVIAGYEPNAVLNKIKSAPMPNDDPRSRVVCIAGPPSIVNVDNLDGFFKHHFYFEPDRVLTLLDRPDFRFIEFRFGSARCQGENAIQALQRQTALAQSPAA